MPSDFHEELRALVEKHADYFANKPRRKDSKPTVLGGGNIVIRDRGFHLTYHIKELPTEKRL